MPHIGMQNVPFRAVKDGYSERKRVCIRKVKYNPLGRLNHYGLAYALVFEMQSLVWRILKTEINNVGHHLKIQVMVPVTGATYVVL